MKFRRLVYAFIMGVTMHASLAMAGQAVSAVGHIVGIETGWSQDTMAIFLDVPTVNPTPGCSNLTGGYALDPNDPGVRVHEAAILGAHLTGRRVYVRVEGCVFSKPKVIAVGVLD